MVVKALRLGCVAHTVPLGRTSRAAKQGHEAPRFGKFWLLFSQL